MLFTFSLSLYTVCVYPDLFHYTHCTYSYCITYLSSYSSLYMCILYERERNRWCPLIKIRCQVVAIVFVLSLTSTCTLYKLTSLEQILALAPLLRGIPTHKIIIVVVFSKSENVWHSLIFRLRLGLCAFFTFKPLHLCFVYYSQ